MESYICPNCEIGLVENDACLSCKTEFTDSGSKAYNPEKKKKIKPILTINDKKKMPKYDSDRSTSWLSKTFLKRRVK